MAEARAPDSPLLPEETHLAADYDGQLPRPVAKETPATRFLWILTLSAGISGLLFGYDTGVISSTLVSINLDLSQHPLSTFEKSLITSCTSFFALVASPAAGLLADRLGRRWVIIIADVLFLLGASIQAVSWTVWEMTLGRSIVGLAIGSASLAVPLYISELSPPALRGRLVTVTVLFITCGQMVAYLIGWGLSRVSHGWRWMVGFGSVPAIIQLILLLGLPESPRWLITAGRPDQAKAILRRVYGFGSRDVVEGLARAIELQILQDEEIRNFQRLSSDGASKDITSWFSQLQETWSELFEVGSNRRALTIACLLQGLQQLCGFNSLMYFSATIFSLVGFTSPTLASLSVAVTNFIFTLIALGLIDRIGRRRILLLSVPIMAVGLLCVAVSFYFLPHMPKDKVPVVADVKPSIWAYLILFSIVLYVSSYALGLGNVPWQQSELFPLFVRSLGSGVATSVNWGSNFIVGLTFLSMMQFLTPPWTFVFYALVCGAGWLSIYKIYPEAKGLGLEEIGILLKDGWGVEQSLLRNRAG